MRRFLLVFVASLLACAPALADFDLGDLLPCNYPTQFGNPSHSITDKAWLGECVTGEFNPWPVNGDPCDDGVIYLGPFPWLLCQQQSVQVIVTIGPNYAGEQLFVNGWKDGNLDGDFCDTLCAHAGVPANEWIVQDVPVGPGVFTFAFMDPGVDYLGPLYPGVFRWRLTDRPIGRMGFGFYDPFNCSNMPFCGNFAADSMGEVEDYWINDFQYLQVTLNGFDVVPGDNRVTLRWSTASETNNDHFEIIRNGEVVHRMAAAGNSATEQRYSWTDNSVHNDVTYMYSLVAVDANGQREALETASATPSFGTAVVTEYALHQNYPNPFNANTSITFDLVEAGHATLTIYNMVGQKVATLTEGLSEAGRHTISFNAGSLPSGIYLYRLEANGFVDQKKMLLLK